MPKKTKNIFFAFFASFAFFADYVLVFKGQLMTELSHSFNESIVTAFIST